MIRKRDIVLVLSAVVISVGLMKLLQPSDKPVSISSDNAWSRFVNDAFDPGTGNSFVKAARIGMPAVVRITVRNRAFQLWESGSVVSSGSGVFISGDGYIVTNHHVLSGGNLYEITSNDGKKYEATLIGSDESTDIAVLKIEKQHCPYLTLANSDSVQVGQWVIAIGNPYQLNSTVTSGIVSGKGRTIDLLKGDYPLESFIQTDAVFNEGNSGGALINEAGELIGINTAIFTRSGKFEGYSFAIPSNIVRKMVRDIISYGKVQRAMLGVGIEDITDRLSRRIGEEPNTGVYVNRVSAGSAAAKAGLMTGDIITAVNGVRISNYPALQEQIALFQPGDAVNVQFRRKGAVSTVEVILSSPAATGPGVIIRSEAPLRDLGLEIRYAVERPENGLVIHSVIKGGPADRARIRPGFEIHEVNGVEVDQIEALLREVSKNQSRLILKGIDGETGQQAQYTIVRPGTGL